MGETRRFQTLPFPASERGGSIHTRPWPTRAVSRRRRRSAVPDLPDLRCRSSKGVIASQMRRPSDAVSIQRWRWQRDGKNAIVDQVELRLLGGEDHRMDIERGYRV
jgi:hypothetical protein